MSWIGFLRLGRPGTLDSTPKVSRLCYECLLLLVRQTGGTKCTVNGCSLNSNVVSIYRRTENRRSFTTILPSPLSVGKVSPPRRPKCCLMFYRGWGGGGGEHKHRSVPKTFLRPLRPQCPLISVAVVCLSVLFTLFSTRLRVTSDLLYGRRTMCLPQPKF